MKTVIARGWMAMALVATSLTSLNCNAQTKADSKSTGTVVSTDRPATITRQGLDDPGLKLTSVQKYRIDALMDNYLSEQRITQAKYPPPAGGGPPNAEMMKALAETREKFAASVNKVLDETQRKTWVAAQQSARPNRGVSPVGTLNLPPAKK